MMRRTVWRLAWVGGALCLVGLAFGVTVRLLGPEPPGVTEANVKKIRPGMDLQEVEAILGGPGHLNISAGGLRSWTSVYTWDGLGGRATVVVHGRFRSRVPDLDTEERVDHATFERHEGVGPLSRLRSLLGLQPSTRQTP
jgi:hypothetical protein